MLPPGEMLQFAVQEIIVGIVAVVFGSSGILALVINRMLHKNDKKSARLNSLSMEIEIAKWEKEKCHLGFQDEIFRAVQTGKQNGELAAAKKALECANKEVDKLYQKKKILIERNKK